MAAAYLVREAWYRVQLLERGDCLGGRMRTVKRDGFMFEEVPGGLTRGHTAILRIVHDAGPEDELVVASSKSGSRISPKEARSRWP